MRQSTERSYGYHFFLIVAAYYAAGQFGSLFNIQPIQASPIYPAAGVALAALLTCGIRCWPAIAVGAVLSNSNWIINVHGDEAGFVIVTVALGASLQAVVGAWSIKRLKGYPSGLEKIRTIYIILLVGGPLACLISATAASSVQYILGTGPIDTYLFAWFAWWVGDSTGVVLFTAPILILLGVRDKNNQQRRLAIFLAFSALFVAIVAFVYLISDSKRAEIESYFAREVSERKQKIEQSIEQALGTLRSAEGLFTASNDTSLEGFDTFGKHVFTNKEIVQAVGWAPRVNDNELAAVEAKARKEGRSDFRIIEYDQNGVAIPAGSRPEHYPVYYIYPLSTNEKAVGFDLVSSASRRTALFEARDTNQTVATAPITLVQETGKQAGFLMATPIYSPDIEPSTVDMRRQGIRGFVTGVFRVGDMIDAALKGVGHADVITLHVQDLNAPVPDRTVYGTHVPRDDWLYAEEIVSVASRSWHISFAPNEEFYEVYTGLGFGPILGGSFVFSWLCSFLILIVAGRNSLMQKLVNERTSELGEARRYVDGITENAPGLLSYIGADLRYKFVNKSYERWFDLPQNSFIGLPIQTGVSKETWEIVEPQIEAVLEGKVASFEVNVPFKDKDDRYTHVTYTPDINDNGAVHGFFVAVEDRTSVKRSEEELQAINQSLEVKNEQLVEATKKAESATRMKSEFLAVMSHEIRTPMNGIMGTTDLLLETKLSGTQRKYAKTTMSSAEALLGLINDILDFSKIEAGKLSLEEVPFDMQHVAEDVLDMIALKCDSTEVELLLDYAPGTARQVLGDPGRVRQILLNLMSNAVKFTSEGHILMRFQSRAGDNGELEFRVEVKDTGIGIPEDKHNTIFNKFDQADQSTTRKYGGTGLGLSICERLTGMMGGNIGLDSAVGKGSTFWFTMRLRESDDHAPVNEELLAGGGLKGAKLLIVDDNEVARKILREQLRSKHAEVSLVENAKQALDGLRSEAGKGKPFDIAIVDYRMPGMDGKALAQAIKADDTIKDTSIVMITSSPVRGDGVEMHDLGVAGYLVKPTRAIDVGRVLHFIWDMKKQGTSYPHLVTRHSLTEAQEAMRKAPEFNGVHILLAEDNPVNQMVAMTLLKKYGCTVMPAGDGAEAVAAVKENEFDLVIMDCQMPNMDGFEATETIRRYEEESGNSRLPIIAFTANAMKGDKERCLAAGMDDYVTKPVNQKELENALMKWLLQK